MSTTMPAARRDDAPAAAPALEVRGLAKRFGGLRVFEALDFAVAEGEVFGLAGPNGAGKTTVLNVLSGVLPGDGGEVRVHGAEAAGRSTLELAGLGLARTFQNIRLFHGMTVLEQVVCGGYRHRGVGAWRGMLGARSARAEDRAAREEGLDLLGLVGLAEHADRLAETMPYGSQRRVEIARALATRPRVLLLDEPTAGMNASDWAGIGELLVGLRERGTTLVVVEHNMRLIEAVCDRVAVLAAGELIACGPPRTTLREPAVRTAYFGQ